MTFKYLGRITRILCQRHNSYIEKASFCLSKIINILSSPGNFRNKGVIWVWVTEEGTDGEQHLGEKCFKSGQVYAIGPGNHVIKGFMQTFDTVSAGDHWDRRMSRHMAPLLG